MFLPYRAETNGCCCMAGHSATVAFLRLRNKRAHSTRCVPIKTTCQEKSDKLRHFRFGVQRSLIDSSSTRKGSVESKVGSDILSEHDTGVTSNRKIICSKGIMIPQAKGKRLPNASSYILAVPYHNSVVS